MAILVPHLSSANFPKEAIGASFEMLKHSSLVPSVCSFIAAVLIRFETDIDIYNLLTSTIAEYLLSENRCIRVALAERVLSLMRLDSKILVDVLHILKSSTSPYMIEMLIMVLKYTKQPLSRNHQFYGIFKDAITSSRAHIRHSAFGFICHTNFEVTDEDIELVKRFMELDTGENDDSDNKVLYSLKTWLLRLGKYIYIDLRSIQNARRKAAFAGSPLDLTELDRNLKEKLGFYSWLQDFVIKSLFPGASHARTSRVISFLDAMHQSKQAIILECLVIDPDSQKIFSGLSEDEEEILFSQYCRESYDMSRHKIMGFVDYHKPSILSPNDYKFSQLLLQQIPTLIKSLRVSESESAVALIQYVFVIYIKRGLTVENSKKEGKSGPINYLTWLSNLLDAHLQVAALDLGKCSYESPLNGILMSISEVLKVMDLKNLLSPNNSSFMLIITRIIESCYNACQYVLKVCTNSSPEGNLNASFKEIGNNIAALNSGESTSNLAQIVLRHCFRTIKEGTEVLRTISQAFVHISTSKFERDFLIRYGDFLCSLISSIRHRGALSAAQLNFTHLCIFLGKSGMEDLLSSWLDSFVAQITTKEVSVTRRSAGLPLGILAILKSGGKCCQEMLKSTIGILLNIINEPNITRNEDCDLSQVHALNILRVIIQDSDLTSLTRIFIEPSFEICIRQFSSMHFPIRNCASMLFAALVLKSFGSKVSSLVTLEIER